MMILKDSSDNGVNFVEVYQRPIYYVRNMAGKSFGLLWYGYPV
jgi:hypothetical protein